MNMIETFLYTLTNYTDLMSKEDLLKLSPKRNLALAQVELLNKSSVYLFAHSGNEEPRVSKRGKGELYNLKKAKDKSDELKVTISTPKVDNYDLIPVKRKSPDGKEFYDVDSTEMLKKKGIDHFQAIARDDKEEATSINNKLIEEM